MIQNNEENFENYTFIEIAKKKYAINTKYVREILKLTALDFPHQMPSYILGLIEFEKKPLGVIDLREIFQNERIVYDLSSKIIVIQTQNHFVSLICDNVLDINKIETSQIKQVPYQSATNFFDGVYISQDLSAYILNIDNVLDFCQKNQDRYKIESSQKYIINDENSLQILEKRKEFLTQTTTEIQKVTTLFDRGVIFTINDAKYYINMANVKEFYKVNNSKFIKIPCTKDFILGLVNIKGEYITVVDIRRFFYNSKTQIKEKSTIIILNSDEFKIGILTDEICESMDIDFEKIVQNRIQKQDDNSLIEFVLDNEIYQVIDVEKLLSDERLAVL